MRERDEGREGNEKKVRRKSSKKMTKEEESRRNGDVRESGNDREN